MRDRLARLPWYGQIAAVIALAAVVAGGVRHSYVQPAQDSLRARAALLASLEGEIVRGLVEVAELPATRHAVTGVQARLDRLRIVLPEERDVAELLRGVQAMAAWSNLTILGFTPQETAERDQYVEWPIRLQLVGTYHDLGTFLEYISRSRRIINVDGFTISAREASERGATITADCTATAFVPAERVPAVAEQEGPRPLAGAAGPGGSGERTDRLIEPPGFAYDREDRRDPFVSLLRRNDEAERAPAVRPPGLSGLTAAEVTLRGTLRGESGFVAILEGPDRQAYIVRPGDRLFDGTITAITGTALVVVQDSSRPGSLQERREVRKTLRWPEVN